MERKHNAAANAATPPLRSLTAAAAWTVLLGGAGACVVSLGGASAVDSGPGDSATMLAVAVGVHALPVAVKGGPPPATGGPPPPVRRGPAQGGPAAAHGSHSATKLLYTAEWAATQELMLLVQALHAAERVGGGTSGWHGVAVRTHDASNVKSCGGMVGAFVRISAARLWQAAGMLDGGGPAGMKPGMRGPGGRAGAGGGGAPGALGAPGSGGGGAGTPGGGPGRIPAGGPPDG